MNPTLMRIALVALCLVATAIVHAAEPLRLSLAEYAERAHAS